MLGVPQSESSANIRAPDVGAKYASWQWPCRVQLCKFGAQFLRSSIGLSNMANNMMLP